MARFVLGSWLAMGIAAKTGSTTRVSHVVSTRRRLINAWVRSLPALHREAGLTLVEMSVVLVIISLVAVSIIPLLWDFSVTKAKGAGEQVAAAMRLAREYAIGFGGQYDATVTSTTVQITCSAADCTGAATEPQISVVDDGTVSCFAGDDATPCTSPWKVQFTSTGAAVAARTLHVSVSGVADQRVCVTAAGRVVLMGPGVACP